MFRLSSISYVRFLTNGVKALPSIGPGALVDKALSLNYGATSSISSQRFFYEQEASQSRTPVIIDGRSSGRGTDKVSEGSRGSKHEASILRLGGAQVLSSTAHAYIPNENGSSPIYYSKTTPRESGLCASIVAALRKLNIHKLTDLQGALVPLMLRGKHVVAHAETGTGKSFGIALAIANKIVRESISYRLHTVIFTPTEELALQYDRWLKHFGGCASQICQPAIDSIPLETQLTKLHNIQPHVLVGTASRIAEISESAPHIFGHKLRRTVDTIVLDEADLILNVEVMLKNIPTTGGALINRLYRSNVDDVPAQIVAASATVDGATAQQINEWMQNDRAVRISTSFVKHSLPSTIDFYFVAGASHRNIAKEKQIQTVIENKEDKTKDDQSILPSTKPTPSSLTPSELFSLAIEQSPVALPQGRELLRVLSLIYKHHSIPRVVIFTSYDTERVCAFINHPAAVDYIVSQSAGKLSRGSSSSDNKKGNEGDEVDERVERGPQTTHDYTNMLRDHGILAAPLQHSTDPNNLDCQLRARQIVGKNREIIIKNNTNISKLSDGRLLMGVGGYALSRGMHIGNVSHVIILGEAPSSMEFVHCAGRTGRMGKHGEVFTIFPPTSGKLIQSVCQAVELPFRITKLSSIVDVLDMEDFTPAEVRSNKEAQLIRREASYYRQEELKKNNNAAIYKYTTGIEGTPPQFIKEVDRHLGNGDSGDNYEAGSRISDSMDEATNNTGVNSGTTETSDLVDAIFDIMSE